jgi:L-alanine-DL-glutamate epimerase-like enolase superfamily enzyme
MNQDMHPDMHPAHPPSLRVAAERWPIAGAFTISRGSKTESHVVVVEVSDGVHRGRGECVPYGRYGETVEGVSGAIAALGPEIARGLDRRELQAVLPAGAARNALDCALWDLAAKRAQQPVHVLAGLASPRRVVTAYTISLGSPDAMAAATRKAAARALLKVKLGQPGDPDRIRAVRAAAPRAELIVDANEGWTGENLDENLAACAAAGVTLVEQPLPADADAALAGISPPIPICADESVHDRASLRRLAGRYQAINIKLDKTGGLTEALALATQASQMGFGIMVGCMISTSLAIAPALLVAAQARVVDLDGALLLARDRPEGLRYDGSLVHPATPDLWG